MRQCGGTGIGATILPAEDTTRRAILDAVVAYKLHILAQTVIERNGNRELSYRHAAAANGALHRRQRRNSMVVESTYFLAKRGAAGDRHFVYP